MKQIEDIANDLYKDIERDRRTVEPAWDTVLRTDEDYANVPSSVLIPKRIFKKYLMAEYSPRYDAKKYYHPDKAALFDYIADKYGWLVKSLRYDVTMFANNPIIKPLDRLTEYALGKRSQKYTAKERKKDTDKLMEYIDENNFISIPMLKPTTKSIRELKKKDFLKLILDALIEKNKEYVDLMLLSLQDYQGVILFSGGLDSVALAIGRSLLYSNQLSPLLPVYISHRANVGNVTKKEILAARKLAKKLFGEELVVIKPDTKAGVLPDWYGKRVYVTKRMPVIKTQKNKRNRKFLEVLKDYGLADKQIWLGVLGIPGAGDRSRAAGRAKDVTKEGLQEHLKKIGGKGKIKVVRDLSGVKTKSDLLKKIETHYGKKFRPDIFESQSCLMYFNKPCGDCWSCVERAESIMQAYGQDRTPYRKDSKADKIRRKK